MSFSIFLKRSCPSRRTFLIDTFPSSILRFSTLTRSWRRSVLSGGTGTVILVPSLEGLNPMSDISKLFSISFMAALSQGWTMMALASGAEMDAI